MNSPTGNSMFLFTSQDGVMAYRIMQREYAHTER